MLKPGQVSADALLDAIDASKANALCSVPWMLDLFRENIAADETDGNGNTLRTLQRLEFIVTGGSNPGATLGVFFRERDVRIVTMLGLPEAVGVVLHSPWTAGHRKPCGFRLRGLRHEAARLQRGHR